MPQKLNEWDPKHRTADLSPREPGEQELSDDEEDVDEDEDEFEDSDDEDEDETVPEED